MDHRRIIQWDKDDLDAMGRFSRCAGAGMLSATAQPAADQSVRGIQAGNAQNLWPTQTHDLSGRRSGVFQIESRAQMSMLPRLQPRCFTTWWWKWFIVRPGLIVAWSTVPENREIVRGGGQIVLEHAS
jgi:error-prone DNA polymerase